MRALTTWIRSSPWLALIVAILIGWGLATPARDATVANAAEPGLQGRDVQTQTSVTNRVRNGEDYYSVVAEELPSRGYASGSVFNWRLPSLVFLNAMLPSLAWSQGFLIVAGFCVVMTWTLVLRQEIPKAATMGVPLLVVCMGSIFMRNTALLHELWAGLLIAASLACWSLDRPRLSVVLGTAAVLIRELSVPFVLIMAVMAWRDSRKKEAAAWMGALFVFGAAWLWHASYVRPLIPANGVSSSWLVLEGWRFVLATSQANPILLLVPRWLLALIVPVVWAGFWSWRTATGQRLAFVITGYFAFFMFAGRPENWYWGFLIAPLLGLGALGYFFVPSALTRIER